MRWFRLQLVPPPSFLPFDPTKSIKSMSCINIHQSESIPNPINKLPTTKTVLLMKKVPLPTTKTFQQTCLAQVGTNITCSEQSFALQTFFASGHFFSRGCRHGSWGSMPHAIDEIRNHWIEILHRNKEPTIWFLNLL